MSRKKTVKINGEKYYVENTGNFTLPYYDEVTGETAGIALIPMLDRETYPHTVFEFLKEQRQKNPNYRPSRKDLEQFPYITFPTVEELAASDRMLTHYLQEWDLLGRQ